MESNHSDYIVLSTIRDAIYQKISPDKLEIYMQASIDDGKERICVLTRENNFNDCDPTAKSVLGLLIEGDVREVLDIKKNTKKGKRGTNGKDLNIENCIPPEQQERFASAALILNVPNPFQVDVKHSLRTGWLVPPESYKENGPLFLVGNSHVANELSVGLALAKPEYLSEKSNRDGKKQFTAAGKKNILWIAGKKLNETQRKDT